MRTIDVFYAFPSVLLAIALSGALGAGVVNSLISLTSSSSRRSRAWPKA
jgi:peptide/nickel transport system permease protein